jgi:hypothetical protein
MAALHRAARSPGTVPLILSVKIAEEVAPRFAAITAESYAVIALIYRCSGPSFDNRENGLQDIERETEIQARNPTQQR